MHRAGHPEFVHRQSRAQACPAQRDALAEPRSERLDDVGGGDEALPSGAVPHERQQGTHEVPLGLHDHGGGQLRGP
jgi:hypothetical protein